MPKKTERYEEILADILHQSEHGARTYYQVAIALDSLPQLKQRTERLYGGRAYKISEQVDTWEHANGDIIELVRNETNSYINRINIRKAEK